MAKFLSSVDFGSIEKLSKILGAFDENLNFLARELDVIPFVDGVKICLQGESENVNLASQVLTALLTLAENGESVDKGRMAYCIELALKKKKACKSMKKFGQGFTERMTVS